jgi:uncharacterized protein (UPF0333 family)
MKQIKLKNLEIVMEKQGQGSAEMILLIGSVLIIVILVGNYTFNLSEEINNNLKGLIEKERDNILYDL